MNEHVKELVEKAGFELAHVPGGKDSEFYYEDGGASIKDTLYDGTQWMAAVIPPNPQDQNESTQPTPSVPDFWPIHEDPFAYVIQHLNSNPYPPTKDEAITLIKELRALHNAATEAKP